MTAPRDDRPLEIRDQDLEITTCPRCTGMGRVSEPPEPGSMGFRQDAPCRECDGRGFKRTPTGAKHFVFIRNVMQQRPGGSL